MQTPSNGKSLGDEQSLLNFKLDPEVLLGLTALPVLVGITGASAIAASIHELGRMSEEIFRGDQLPILEFSDPATDSDPSS